MSEQPYLAGGERPVYIAAGHATPTPVGAGSGRCRNTYLVIVGDACFERVEAPNEAVGIDEVE